VSNDKNPYESPQHGGAHDDDQRPRGTPTIMILLFSTLAVVGTAMLYVLLIAICMSTATFN
jgi:hypothetical protein